MREQKEQLSEWEPKTQIGLSVKSGEIKDIDQILDTGRKILEPEIVDTLIPNLSSELLMIGQSKGKFGGGQRRVFRQTQKKTKEGNVPSFSTFAVVGDGDGHVGLGFGKSKETVPAREKATRRAKLNLFKIRRGAGSWEDATNEPHSLPFEVEGKSGSVRVVLKPAPKGTGLCCEKEIAKILKACGIKDVWSKTFGATDAKINLIQATEKALHKLVSTKIQSKQVESLHIIEGSIESVAPFMDESDEEETNEEKSDEVKKDE